MSASRYMHLGFMALFAPSMALAGSYSSTAIDQGWYSSTGSHTPSNTNYLTGSYGSGYRDFFSFNLAGLSFATPGSSGYGRAVSAANIQIYTASKSGTPTLTFYDVSTPYATLVAGTGGTSTYNDLGSGTSYGSALVGANYTTQTFALNSNATSQLTTLLSGSGSNYFSLGGAATGGYAFGASGGNFAQLNLTTADPIASNVLPNTAQSRNVRVGDTVTVANSLRNTGVSGTILAGSAVGSLAVGGGSPSLTSLGSINLTSGNSQAYSFAQAINAAGAYSSQLNYTGLNTGSSGYTGSLSAGSVSGNAYNAAQAGLSAASLDFGNVREGTTQTGNLQVANTAAAGSFSERLNSSLGANNGNVALSSGSFTGIVAGGNQTETVTFNTTGTGAKTSTITVSSVSSGAGSSGLADLALADQTVSVSGAVYGLANPVVDTTPITFVGRVGDSLGTQAIGVTNQSADQYREGLDASVAASGSPFTSSGSIANLAAQGSDGSSLKVGVSTATSGSFSGTATVGLASTGTGTTGEASYGLASQALDLVARIYDQAVASVQNTLVDFGIVHKGDTVASRALTVSNTASGALSDNLVTSLTGIIGPFASDTGPDALAAGQTGDWRFNLDTSSDGQFHVDALLHSVSRNGELADLALADSYFGISAQVNNWASPVFDLGHGATLTRNGNDLIIDFGTVQQGSGIHNATFSIGNDAAGLADWLGIDFTGNGGDFQTSGLTDFLGLTQNDAMRQLVFGLDSSQAGAVQNTLLFSALSGNASGTWNLGDYTLTIRGDVVAASSGNVPEPGTLVLLGAAGLVFIGIRRRKPSAA